MCRVSTSNQTTLLEKHSLLSSLPVLQRLWGAITFFAVTRLINLTYATACRWPSRKFHNQLPSIALITKLLLIFYIISLKLIQDNMARALFKGILLVKTEAESNGILTLVPNFTLSRRLQLLMHDSEEYIYSFSIMYGRKMLVTKISWYKSHMTSVIQCAWLARHIIWSRVGMTYQRMYALEAYAVAYSFALICTEVVSR